MGRVDGVTACGDLKTGDISQATILVTVHHIDCDLLICRRFNQVYRVLRASDQGLAECVVETDAARLIDMSKPGERIISRWVINPCQVFTASRPDLNTVAGNDLFAQNELRIDLHLRERLPD